ncbi:MAG: hypothetical protein IKN12_02435 [Selenomonadaceae bacterium]|nr:hypothetical protein [Selenomonadaceae bacterium]
MTEETGNKQYRDSVFCHYFQDKTRLLSLCNALLNTNYTDTGERKEPETVYLLSTL